MVCGFVVKSFLKEKCLLLSRQAQNTLANDLAHFLGYRPFIFNTRQGIYLFLASADCTPFLEEKLKAYCKTTISVPHLLYNCSKQLNFFMNEVAIALNDKNSSSLGWKSFISSFLGQLDPFIGASHPVASLFKRFVGIIKFKGKKTQLDYLKRKMNLLRERVDLKELLKV